MSKRKAERMDGEYCHKCGQRISPNNATQLYYKRAHENLEEQLEEEKKSSKTKIAEKDDEITLLKGTLETEKYFYREEIEKLRKKLEEYTRESELERVQGEADTKRLEERFRESAATKKDIEEICANLLSSQYASLKQQKDEEMSTLLKKFKAELSENDTRCPDRAENCNRIRSDCSNLQEKLHRAESKEKQLMATIEHQKEQIKMLTQKVDYAQMIEAQHTAMANKVAELEEKISKRHTPQLNKRPTSYSQPEVLEDLNIEYEKLFANAKVLNLVEDYFNDTFDAKCFLSDIFMDAYERCKKCLKKIVCKNIDELFKLQTCENRTDDMEGLSHAFGLLLQTSGIKLLVTKSEAVSDVQEKVKENVSQLRGFKKAKVDPTNALKKLPLDKFVELAWKFVAQAYPVIVSMPEMLAYNEDIHKSSFHHWDEERKEERPLIYAQPIVYRSYHGEVLIKGFVGNCELT